MIKKIISLMLLLMPVIMLASDVDSTISRLRALLPDEAFVDSLNELAYENRYLDSESATAYAKAGLSWSVSIPYLAGQGDAYNRLGLIKKGIGELDSSLFYQKRSLKVREQLGDPRSVARAKNNIGGLLRQMGRFEEAMVELLDAYEIRKKEVKIPGEIASSNNNLGALYAEMGDLDTARYYFHQAADVYETLNHWSGVAEAHNNIGGTWFDQAVYDSAMVHLEEALDIEQQLFELGYNGGKDSVILARIYMNLGNANKLKYELKSALDYYKAAIGIQKRLGLKLDLGKSYSNMGVLHEMMDEARDAITYHLKSLEIAYEVNNLTLKKHAVKNLAYSYRWLENEKEASKYDKLYNSIRDTLQDERFAAVQERGKMEVVTLQASLKAQKLQSWIYRIVSAGIVALSFLGFTFYQSWNRKKMEAREKEFEVETMAAVLDSQLEERNRFATEIHSGLCSNIMAIKNDLAYTISKLDQLDEKSQSRFESALNHLADAGKDARRYSHELAPLVLEKLGLVDAVEQYAGKVSKEGATRVEVQDETKRWNVSKKIERNLYFILLELIQNSFKYAEADLISLRFYEKEGELVISYKDDGKGFDVDHAFKHGGHGMTSMKIRARQSGASFRIRSSAGKGMQVIMELPIT